MPVIYIQSEKFDAAMRRLAEVGGEEAIRPQAGLLVRELVKITPPDSLSQGRKAVERDLRRAVQPIQAADFTSPKIRKAIESKNAGHVGHLLSIIRKGQWRVESFTPELHRAARKYRGRVGKKMKVATLDVVAWKKYLRTIQARVGRMKAAWMPAASKLSVKLPGYVSRQSAPSGSCVDGLKDRNPSFRMDSFAPGVETETGRTIRRALEGRARAIAGKVRYLIREAKKKGGL